MCTIFLTPPSELANFYERVENLNNFFKGMVCIRISGIMRRSDCARTNRAVVSLVIINIFFLGFIHFYLFRYFFFARRSAVNENDLTGHAGREE